jgi:hypothetical protein
MTNSVRVGFPGTEETRIIAVTAYPRESERGFYAIDDKGNRLDIDDDGYPITGDSEPDASLKVRNREAKGLAPADSKATPDTVKKTPTPADQG